jgi:hypothetical protein
MTIKNTKERLWTRSTLLLGRREVVQAEVGIFLLPSPTLHC